MNPGCRVRDQLNTSELTAPYIIGRELNLRKLPGRQWESCPQPYEQLRPKTIGLAPLPNRPRQPILQLKNLHNNDKTYLP